MLPIDGTHESGIPTRGVSEELLNAATHAAGFVLSIVGAMFLVLTCSRTESWTASCCVLYATLLVLVYAVSTLSHTVHKTPAKQVLRMWDQGLIYLFIAGTYTPLVCAHVPVVPRTVALAVTWGAAAAGFYSKVVARHRINALATWGYVLLGWGPALILMPYVPGGCLIWLVSGGLFYTLGICFLKADGVCRYFHAAWHVFVILGSACHYAAIMIFVVLGA